jgi:hypothetical protein
VQLVAEGYRLATSIEPGHTGCTSVRLAPDLLDRSDSAPSGTSFSALSEQAWITQVSCTPALTQREWPEIAREGSNIRFLGCVKPQKNCFKQLAEEMGSLS